jgi:hypothetical protein
MSCWILCTSHAVSPPVLYMLLYYRWIYKIRRFFPFVVSSFVFENLSSFLSGIHVFLSFIVTVAGYRQYSPLNDSAVFFPLPFTIPQPSCIAPILQMHLSVVRSCAVLLFLSCDESSMRFLRAGISMFYILAPHISGRVLFFYSYRLMLVS